MKRESRSCQRKVKCNKETAALQRFLLNEKKAIVGRQKEKQETGEKGRPTRRFAN